MKLSYELTEGVVDVIAAQVASITGYLDQTVPGTGIINLKILQVLLFLCAAYGPISCPSGPGDRYPGRAPGGLRLVRRSSCGTLSASSTRASIAAASRCPEPERNRLRPHCRGRESSSSSHLCQAIFGLVRLREICLVWLFSPFLC